MIVAALATAIAALALGIRGGSTESFLSRWLAEWRKYLRKYVHDDERRARAEAIVNQQFEQLDAYFVDIDVQLRALYDIHRDYDASSDDYVPYIDDMFARFGELQHEQITAFSQMHRTLTADEWNSIEARIGKRIDESQAKVAKAAGTAKGGECLKTAEKAKK
jgi:hypothetical protein